VAEGVPLSLFRRLRALAIAAIAMAGPFLTLPALGFQSASIRVVARIQNSPPQVLRIALTDEAGRDVDSLDPGCIYRIMVTVADSNTISDIMNLTVCIYEADSGLGHTDSPTCHYTYFWGSASFAGPDAYLVRERCSAPQDMMQGDGTWVFAVRLEKVAEYSGNWVVMALAKDDAEMASGSVGISVNRYISASISPQSITLSGAPGRTVPVNENPLALTYTSNAAVRLELQGSRFIGEDVPSFSLGPEAFIFDDDDKLGESPEISNPEMVLSQERRTFASDLPPGSAIVLQLFMHIRIPDPFYDQSYDGVIAFQIS